MSSASRRRFSIAEQLREKHQTEAPNKLSSLFEEEPVDLDTFVRDKAYLNNPDGLYNWQFDFNRHLEQIYNLDTYIAMVEEFGEHWNPVRMVNYLIAEVGKCQVAGERVYNAQTGQWVFVEDLKPGSVAAVGPQGGVAVAEGSASWVSGRGECYEIRTRLGAVNRVADGHRYLTPGGWRRVWDLKAGDKIANAVYLPCTEPQRADDREIEAVATWLGDGCITEGNHGVRTYFDSRETMAVERYTEILRSWGMNPTVDVDGFCCTVTAGQGRTICANGHEMDGHNSYVKLSGRTRCRRCVADAESRRRARGRGEDVPKRSMGRRKTKLRQVAESWGVYGLTSHTKFIPPAVFSLPDDQLRLFISRLWRTDGNVNRGSVEYTSVSERLARDVSLLLRRFGIRSKVVQRKTSWHHNGETHRGQAWVVLVIGCADVCAFHREFDLLDKRAKQDAELERYRTVKARPAREQDFVWDTVASIESIGVHEYYDLEVPGLENYVGNDGLVAHNSGGKDHSCRIGVSRGAYLLNCLRDPQGYYGLAPQDDIHTLNVAPTSNLARRVFFKPLGQLIQRSSWFKGRVLSEITPNSTSILLTKQVELVSGHSLIESFEGLNPIIAIADEIAAVRLELAKSGVAGVDSRSAQAVWAVLRSSARSRFPNNFKCAAISYPRYLNDMIELLVTQGNRDIAEKGIENSRYYVFGPKGTVEVNPKFAGMTAEEAFSEDFDEDPDKANAMYKCMPQRSPNRFFRLDQAITAAFPKLTGEQPLDISYYWADDDPEAQLLAGTRAPMAWQVIHTLNGVVPMAGALYALHADLAVSGDQAGIAMAHVRRWIGPGEDSDEERPVVKVDFVTAYQADLTAVSPDGDNAAREIQLRWVRKLVRELHSLGFAIGLVTFDGWQSQDSIQLLEAMGIGSKVQSIDRTPMPYQTLRDVMYDGRLEAYDDGEVVSELEGLTRLSSGKVDHPSDGKKDRADALAGAVLGALLLGGDEGDMPEVVDNDTLFALSVQGFGEAGIVSQDLGMAGSWSDLQF